MEQGIFISYRRDDDPSFAGRICDRLKRAFSPDRVFMDVEGIEPGDNFTEVLNEWLESCVALLAVIGRKWLTMMDEGGRRRLESPTDFVRKEIETALKRHVAIYPILMPGVSPLRCEELPESLRPLAQIQATLIAHNRFEDDTKELIHTLEGLFAGTRTRAETVRIEKALIAELNAKKRKVEAEYQAAKKQLQETQAEVLKMEACLTALRTQEAEMKQKVATGEADEGSLRHASEMAQQYNNDFKNAMTIFTQRQADDQKAQMERWRILQETQTRIFEIQQDVMTNKLQIQSEAYKRWDEYIRA